MATTYAQLLEAAMALQLQILADPNASGSIGNRSYTRHNLTALQDVIDKLQVAVAKENSVSTSRAAVVRFQGPS
jgi:hypothetical protein